MGKAHRLTAKQVESAKPKTVLQDGAGLMLRTNAGGAKRWILRVQVSGRRRDIGLGSFPVITLAKARAAALDVRRAYADGHDPVTERRAARRQVVTLKEAAKHVHAEHKKAWRSPKTEKLWMRRLEQHVFPKLGDIRVSDVSGPAIRDCLLPIWIDRPVMARKVRGQIVTILDYAHSRGWRDVEAPRNIGRGLPKQRHTVQHHRAMAWRELPAFVASLDKLKCTPPIRAALEFALLTACRSKEIRGATWGEIDLEKAVWVIPPTRMKAGREHRVPLSKRALEVLERMAELRRTGEPDELIFPGRKKGKALSDMSLSMPLRRAGVKSSVHGLRSSFRSWCSEAAQTPREIAELALAHVVESETERAYARHDALERRATLMERWSRFLATGETRPVDVSDLDEARRERGAA